MIGALLHIFGYFMHNGMVTGCRELSLGHRRPRRPRRRRSGQFLEMTVIEENSAGTISL